MVKLGQPADIAWTIKHWLVHPLIYPALGWGWGGGQEWEWMVVTRELDLGRG